MARSVAILSLGSVALLAVLSPARAGDATPAGGRKEFHQSANYPYVFEPVNYLVAQGPAPMRYGPPASEPTLRSAPALPKVEKPNLAQTSHPADAAAEKTAESATTTVASTTESSAAVAGNAGTPPAYPAPQNAPASATSPDADFNKTPDEVVGYFRNPYNFVPDSHRFFDPIFEPAQMQKGPPSKAVYKITK